MYIGIITGIAFVMGASLVMFLLLFNHTVLLAAMFVAAAAGAMWIRSNANVEF